MTRTTLERSLRKSIGRKTTRCTSCGAEITTTPFATTCRECTGKYRVQTVGKAHSIYGMRDDERSHDEL